MTTMYKVNVPGLNFRTGASTEFPIITTLWEGSILEVISSNARTGWSHIDVITVTARTQGYVATEYITPLTEEDDDEAPIRVTEKALHRLAPRAEDFVIKELVKHCPTLLGNKRIDENGLRLSHFWAQMLHESQGLTKFVENLNYSTDGLMKVFPTHFKNRHEASTYHRHPEAIANRVYCNRLGNGPERSGDGWLYRGRGFPHLTGKYNYQVFSDILGIDLVSNPDVVMIPEIALKTGTAYWHKKNLNKWADKNYLKTITRRIQGRLRGLKDRRRRLILAKRIWLP